MDAPQLDPDTASFIDELVESGRYASPEEVVRESIVLMRKREAALARFDAEIQKGIDSIKAGRSVPLDEACDHVLGSIRRNGNQQAA